MENKSLEEARICLDKVTCDEAQSSSLSSTLCCSENIEQSNSDSIESHSKFLTIFETPKDPLGHGSFGVVFKAKKVLFNNLLDVIHWCDCGNPQPKQETTFAIKIIPQGKLSEASFAAELCHPHIVSCYNVWAEDGNSDEFQSKVRVLHENNPYLGSCTITSPEENPPAEISTEYIIPPYLLMQFEFCTENTLQHFLNLREIEPTDPYKYYIENQNIFTQILEALTYMEIKEIVHGDLKPDNIFLTRRGNGALFAKIGDFGLTQIAVKGSTVKETKQGGPSTSSNLPSITQDDIDRNFYQYLYRSPEQAKVSFYQETRYKVTGGANHKSDVYSLALIFIPMLIQFPDDERRRWDIDEMKHSNPDRRNCSAARKLKLHFEAEFQWINEMLSHDIKKRPTASQVKQWTLEGPPGYEINYGQPHPNIKTKLQNMLTGLRLVEDADEEQMDNTSKTVKRRFYFHLSEMVYEALSFLPPDEELLLEILEYHKEYMDAPKSSSHDKRYLYEKYVPLLESKLGIENILTLEWLNTLLLSKLEHNFIEAMEIYNKIRTTQLYQELDATNPFKIELETMIFTLRCPNINLPEYSDQKEFVFKPEELEEALQTCQDLCFNLTNDLGPLHWRLLYLLQGQSALLTELGRINEAEFLFKETISKINKEIEESPDTDLSAFTSYLFCYSKFLERFERFDEAIEVLNKLVEIEKGEGSLEVLDFLLVCHMRKPGFDSDTEEFSKILQKVRSKTCIQKSQRLLPNPDQFRIKEGDMIFNLREVDFEMIE